MHELVSRVTQSSDSEKLLDFCCRTPQTRSQILTYRSYVRGIFHREYLQDCPQKNILFLAGLKDDCLRKESGHCVDSLEEGRIAALRAIQVFDCRV